MSYKNQEIWQLARESSTLIHKMTLTELPKFELFEEGSQIRRSSKSTRSNIVEGYGRRNHVADYLRFLEIAMASNLETIDHLEILFETGSLKDETIYQTIHNQLDLLGKKINKFMQAVSRNQLPKSNN